MVNHEDYFEKFIYNRHRKGSPFGKNVGFCSHGTVISMYAGHFKGSSFDLILYLHDL
jgi:hypothetical protein